LKAHWCDAAHWVVRRKRRANKRRQCARFSWVSQSSVLSLRLFENGYPSRRSPKR